MAFAAIFDGEEAEIFSERADLSALPAVAQRLYR
jgi:hypothetical protein